MNRSMKLGVASVVLLFGCALPSPLNLVAIVISFVLGFLAAQHGSKWWLVVPCTIFTFGLLMMYVGFHAT
jgi:hypothetical protein